MMTTPKEKKVKRDEDLFDENLFFDNSEEIILTKEEVKDLKQKLENTEVDKKTQAFFKSTHQISKKLRENDYKISLEEIEKLK